MVASVIFLASIVAMIILVAWTIRNDDLGASGKTTGFLAMKEPDDTEPAPQQKRPPPYIG